MFQGILLILQPKSGKLWAEWMLVGGGGLESKSGASALISNNKSNSTIKIKNPNTTEICFSLAFQVG